MERFVLGVDRFPEWLGSISLRWIYLEQTFPLCINVEKRRGELVFPAGIFPPTFSEAYFRKDHFQLGTNGEYFKGHIIIFFHIIDNGRRAKENYWVWIGLEK